MKKSGTQGKNGSTPKSTLTFKESVIGFGVLIILFGAPAWFIWSITPDSIRYPALYSYVYSIKSNDVHVDKEPSDCNWERAPIGDKGCHYTRSVIPMKNDRGRVTDVYVSWQKVQD